MKKIIMLATAALFSSEASAQQIVAPTSATIDAGGPGFGSINDTINQNGLSAGYTSGVTNFDAYIASAPSHSPLSTFEWFSQPSSANAIVVYDLGSLLGINAMALWNEDFSGIGSFSLLTSADGVNFVAALIGVSPIDNLPGFPYLAQVFNFDATASRYARLEMSGCPRTYNCAIGEVAFRTAAVTAAVPEPATWAMMLLGFGAIGVSLRRRRRTHDMLQTA